jgi:hypothetical protein
MLVALLSRLICCRLTRVERMGLTYSKRWDVAPKVKEACLRRPLIERGGPVTRFHGEDTRLLARLLMPRLIS